MRRYLADGPSDTRAPPLAFVDPRLEPAKRMDDGLDLECAGRLEPEGEAFEHADAHLAAREIGRTRMAPAVRAVALDVLDHLGPRRPNHRLASKVLVSQPKANPIE